MRLIAVTALALLALAAPAAAEVRTLAEVHTPDRDGFTAFPVIDAFEGRVVWSDYDAAIDAWRLTEHVGGVTRALPVEPRETPFDVDLGPDDRGGTLAVYSRCSRGLVRDMPTPQESRRRVRNGCDLYAYSFTTGAETPIARANSTADEYWPAVWRSRVAFVRAYPNRRQRYGTALPYLYLRALAGDRHSRRLRTPAPVITVRESGPEGRRYVRERLAMRIEALDLRRFTVAYAWSRVGDSTTDTFIYGSTAGHGFGPAARGATSGGGAAEYQRRLSSPSINAGGFDMLFQHSGEPGYFGAFSRARQASQASQTSKAVAFAHDDTTAYFIDGGPGARFDATSQPGGTFALKADDAVAYRRMPSGWLPLLPPR